MHRHRQRTAAFSLIELVLVVAIIGTVAMVARPRMLSYVERERVRALDCRIKLDLALARSEAIKRRTPITVNFNVLGGYYEIPGMGEVSTLDGKKAVYRVELSGKDQYAADLVSANFGGTTQVTYDAFGVPDNVGIVTIGSGTAQSTITVETTGGDTKSVLSTK